MWLADGRVYVRWQKLDLELTRLLSVGKLVRTSGKQTGVSVLFVE
jgi:hypothetical protein